jgi:hypothetical protein
MMVCKLLRDKSARLQVRSSMVVVRDVALHSLMDLAKGESDMRLVLCPA